MCCVASISRPGFHERRGRLVLAASAVVAVLLGTTAIWLTQPSSALKANNFRLLRPGMTRPEVERLLGGPPGDYGQFPNGMVDYGDGSVRQVFAVPSARDAKPDTWTDDCNRCYVFFDDRGEVAAGSTQSHFRRSAEGGWLSRFKQMLRAIRF